MGETGPQLTSPTCMPPRQSTLITVDVGNSSLRIGQFDALAVPRAAAPDRVNEWHIERDSLDELHAWLPDVPATWAVSSVNRPAEQRLAQWHQAHRSSDVYHVLSHVDVPLKIDLDRPDRVGMDRLAAAVAANTIRRKDRAIIIVDAGSAITVDIVSATGVFLGGAILPGVSMAAEALHYRTDQLPDVQRDNPVLRFRKQHAPLGAELVKLSNDHDSPPPVVGQSTDAAIRSGLVWGTVGALKFLIQQMGKGLVEVPDVVFAGGDATLLAALVQAAPATYPDLVLSGIALIEHQRKRTTGS